MRFGLFAGCVGTLLGCSAAEPPDRTTAELCPDDALASITIHNETGNAIEVIRYAACDADVPEMYPLPQPLPTGESLTLQLSLGGCLRVTYSGEGCSPDPSLLETPIIECGGSGEITFGQDAHGCIGG